MNAFLYNLRFFLSCLHPHGWRQYTDEYPRYTRTTFDPFDGFPYPKG